MTPSKSHDAADKTAADNARRTLALALEQGDYARVSAEAQRLLPDGHPTKITLAMVDDLHSLLDACGQAGIHPQESVHALSEALSRMLYPGVD